jgi:hypothetical protein
MSPGFHGSLLRMLILFYFLIYVVYSMRVKRNSPKILMDLHILSTPEYEKVLSFWAPLQFYYLQGHANPW